MLSLEQVKDRLEKMLNRVPHHSHSVWFTAELGALIEQLAEPKPKCGVCNDDGYLISPAHCVGSDVDKITIRRCECPAGLQVDLSGTVSSALS